MTTHNDDGSVKDCVVLCPEEGGIRWSHLRVALFPFSARRGRLWRMRWMGYWICRRNETVPAGGMILQAVGVLLRNEKGT